MFFKSSPLSFSVHNSQGPSYPLYPAFATFNPLDYGTPAHCYDARDTNSLYTTSDKASNVSSNLDPVGCWSPTTLANGVKYGDDLTQTWTTAGSAAGDKRPVIDFTAFNGSAAVKADGVDDFLRSTTLAVNQPFTRYVLIGGLTRTTNAQIIDGVAAVNRVQLKVASVNNRQISAGSITTVGTWSTNNEVVAVVHNTTASFCYSNGVLQGSNPSSIGTNNMVGMTLFENRSAAMSNTAALNPASCYVAYILTYAAAHDVTTVAAISQALDFEFGAFY